jgi:hypothetical protein
VGCVLPPLVLLNRLLPEIYQERVFSSFTFFYSISIGVSALLKVAVFGTALVDVLLLPVAFGLLTPVEAEGDFCWLLAVQSWLVLCWQQAPASVVHRRGSAARGSRHWTVCVRPRAFHSQQSTFIDAKLPMMKGPDHVLALQVGMLGSLLGCVALIPLLRAYGAPSPTAVAQPLP